MLRSRALALSSCQFNYSGSQLHYRGTRSSLRVLWLTVTAASMGPRP